MLEIQIFSTEPEENKEATQKPEKEEDKDFHRSDEQLNVCLECKGSQLKNLKKRFLRLSSQATVCHLKKFIALKVYNDMSKYTDVSIEIHSFKSLQ